MSSAKLKEFVALHRLPVITVGTALLLGGFGFWRSTAIDDIKSEIAEKEAEASRLATNIINGQKLDTQLQQITAINQQVKERAITPAALAENQQYFYKIESDAGAKLVDLKQGMAAPRKVGASNFYTSVTYGIMIEGDYKKALDFIRHLESGPRVLRVNGATVIAGRAASAWDSGPSLNVSLDVEFLAL